MDITVTSQNEITILSPKGRIDTATAPELEKKILDFIQIPGIKMIFNLEKVDYVSSAGLRVFLIAAKEIRKSDGKLILCGLHENVHQVLDVSGFLSILSVRADLATALKAF